MAWYEKASDNFNRADESPLSQGGNWSKYSDATDFNLIGSRVAGNGTLGVFGWSIYTGVTLGDNQKVKADLDTLQNYYMGLGIRSTGASVSVRTFYLWYWGESIGYLYKQVSGTYTQLGSNISHATSSTTYELQAESTTISVYRVAELVAQRTDSSVTTGVVSIGTNNSPSYWDNFVCYDDTPLAGHPTMARWGGVPHMTLGRRKW
jgi:hypothetical protein